MSASQTGWALAGLSILLGLACAGQVVRLEDLPEQFVAIRYWEPEQARRRAEALREEKELPTAPREGVARLEDLPMLFGVGRRTTADQFPGHLALLDPRSGAVDPIESATRGAHPLDWSPDRSHLLFASRQFGGLMQLFELDVATGEVRRLTRGPELHPEGCYGPEGRMAFTSVARGSQGWVSRIAVTEAGGVSPRPVSSGPRDSSPIWSPDGQTLVYVTDFPGRGQQIVARTPAPDGPVRALARGRDPVFAPDGETIVYSAPVKGSWKLWRVRRDGSGRARVGAGLFEERWPAVSADGRYVAFVASSDDERQRIAVRRMDGSGERILLDGGDGERPIW